VDLSDGCGPFRPASRNEGPRRGKARGSVWGAVRVGLSFVVDSVRMRFALRVLCIVAVCSCRAAPADRANDVSANPSPSSVPADEDNVKAMTHALLDAHDRADEASFAQAIVSSFVLLDEQRTREHDALLRGLRSRRERHAPRIARTYGDEQVWIGASSAVFVGEAVEHYPADGARPPTDFDGWSTVVWVREGGEWKAVSWQWTKGGLEATRQEWNTTYREGREYNPRPNRFLAEMAKGRAPGVALDVAMGQGRNALYLASQGWRVTGVDISDEGLRQARDAAATRSLHIDTINADLDTWDYGVDKWDLVALIYARASCDARRVDAVRKSLRRGGLVVLEGFHKDANPGLGCGTGELSALFKDGFTILRDEVADDVSDWGDQRGVPEKLVRFAAERL
jgi:SAM-dependent methyltransferase